MIFCGKNTAPQNLNCLCLSSIHLRVFIVVTHLFVNICFSVLYSFKVFRSMMDFPTEQLPLLEYDSDEATEEETAEYYRRGRLFWNVLNEALDDDKKLVPANGAAEPSDDEVAAFLVSVSPAI